MPEFATTPPIPYVPIADKATEVRAAIDAARLSAANSFGGLQKLAIPGPFATDAEASTGGVPDDNLYYRSDGTVRAASHISLDLAFALDKTLTARTGPTPTFTRASGATYVGSDGLIHGIDTSTTSVTFGTGSKTVTLSAPLGQDQMWRVGDAVEIVNSAGALMFGTVTSYTASTQELVCDITSSTGTGTFTTWRIGYRGARFDHDPATLASKGLLIEETRTNYLIHSQDFQNWSISGGIVTRNKELSIADPSGGFTSNRIIVNAGFNLYRDPIAGVPDGNRAFSIYARAVTGGVNLISYICQGAEIKVNLETGALISSAGAVGGSTVVAPASAIGADGFRWYRISSLSQITTGSAGTYLGTYTTISGTRDMYLVWGAQVEVGGFSTSYIPTIPSTASRSADVCSIIGDDFSSFYNQSEGTLFYSPSIANLTGVNRGIVQIDSGANTHMIRNYYDSGFKIEVSANDTKSVLINVAGASNVAQKLAISQQGTLFNAVANGGAISTVTRTAPVGLNTLRIGNLAGGSFYINGHIARIQYFRKRLSNAKLQTLTAP